MPWRLTVARRNGRPARPTCDVERLEPKLAPAGNVAAHLVGSTLFLTGDAQANLLNVASVTGGRLAVVGADTTINGSPVAFVTSRPVTNVVANLARGDDVVAFSNNSGGFAKLRGFLEGSFPGSPVVPQEAINAVSEGLPRFGLPGSLTLATGAGNDTIGIVGDVIGSVVANLGPATGTAYTTGNLFGVGANVGEGVSPLFESRIGGSLSIIGGSRADRVGLYAATIGRSVSAALGEGANSFETITCTIGGGVTVTGSGGDDAFFLAGSVVQRAVAVWLGGGMNDVSFAGGFGGLLRTTVGAVAISTGAGGDTVRMDNLDVVRGVSVCPGAGADEVRIGGGRATTVGTMLTVRLGAGTDALAVRLARARGMWLDGGPGANVLSLSGFVPDRIRRIRFQTVTMTSG
jgi:hypothetical protein